MNKPFSAGTSHPEKVRSSCSPAARGQSHPEPPPTNNWRSQMYRTQPVSPPSRSCCGCSSLGHMWLWGGSSFLMFYSNVVPMSQCQQVGWNLQNPASNAKARELESGCNGKAPEPGQAGVGVSHRLHRASRMTGGRELCVTSVVSPEPAPQNLRNTQCCQHHRHGCEN